MKHAIDNGFRIIRFSRACAEQNDMKPELIQFIMSDNIYRSVEPVYSDFNKKFDTFMAFENWTNL